MDKLLDSCREYSDRRDVAVAKENGKKYTLPNKNRDVIHKYRIDGCVPLPVGRRRCDFLFLADWQPQTAYFVELKGSDIKSAVVQIRDTIRYLKSELSDYICKARIVGHGSSTNIKITPPYRELVQLLGGVEHFHYATNKNFSETI